MKIVLLSIGKTNIDFLREGINEYLKRLKFYVKFENIELNIIKNSKNLSKNELQSQVSLKSKNQYLRL